MHFYISLFFFTRVILFIHPCIYVSIDLSFHSSIHLFIHLYLIYLFIYSSMHILSYSLVRVFLHSFRPFLIF